MAKRFIDTDMFKDPFVRGLEAPLKPLWVYLFCDCNAAGIWNVELDVAKLRCGIDNRVTDDQIKKAFSDKIVEIEDGEKWFIPSFIKNQYNNDLKAKNPATKKVIEQLLFYELIDEGEDGNFILKSSPLEAPSKPLFDYKKGTKDMEKEKEKEVDKEKEKPLPKKIEPKISLPWQSEIFKAEWFAWKAYKQKQHGFKYKAPETEQQTLLKLSQLARGDEATAIGIIRQSIAQGWKGLFELKNSNNDKSKTSAGNNFSNNVRSMGQSLIDQEEHPESDPF